jgi:uncharacterized protein YkwD
VATASRVLIARAPRLAATAVAVVIGVLASEASLSTLAAPAAATLHRSCPHAGVSATRLSKPALRAAVVCLINAERARHGLPRLRDSSRLDSAAQRWAAADDLGHGSGPGAHVSSAGLRWSAVGENVASVAAWMASPGHCQNILDPRYREVGTGVNLHPVRGYASGPATWVQDFALAAGRRAASHNWVAAKSCH